jgi:hypothetical protein
MILNGDVQVGIIEKLPSIVFDRAEVFGVVILSNTAGI